MAAALGRGGVTRKNDQTLSYFQQNSRSSTIASSYNTNQNTIIKWSILQFPPPTTPPPEQSANVISEEMNYCGPKHTSVLIKIVIFLSRNATSEIDLIAPKQAQLGYQIEVNLLTRFV